MGWDEPGVYSQVELVGEAACSGFGTARHAPHELSLLRQGNYIFWHNRLTVHSS